jgi:site-specific recombinase XerD
MYGCGLRISEAVSLQPEQIDRQHSTLRIIGKGNKERLVPLPAPLLTALGNAWLTHHNRNWVFSLPGSSSHISTKTLYRVFAQARAQVKLPEATPHVFRHSYATRLFENDVPVEVVQILLGHTSRKTTQTYLHLTEPLRDQLQQLLGGLMRDLC